MPVDRRYLLRDLQRVRNGVTSRAPGISKCADCREPYIDDHSGLAWCKTCRVRHHRACRDCKTRFPCTRQGHTQCVSCRTQHSLF